MHVFNLYTYILFQTLSQAYIYLLALIDLQLINYLTLHHSAIVYLCNMTQITSNEQQNIEVPKQQVTHNTDCILQYRNAHTPIPFMYFYQVSIISSISICLLSLSLSTLFKVGNSN